MEVHPIAWIFLNLTLNVENFDRQENIFFHLKMSEFLYSNLKTEFYRLSLPNARQRLATFQSHWIQIIFNSVRPDTTKLIKWCNVLKVFEGVKSLNRLYQEETWNNIYIIWVILFVVLREWLNCRLSFNFGKGNIDSFHRRNFCNVWS